MDVILISWVGLVVVHEAAHYFAARSFGIKTRPTISWRKIAMVTDREEIEPKQDLVISLAGPLANILLAIPLWFISPTAAMLSAGLGIFCLIPFKPQDGWRAAKAIDRL